MELVKRPLEKIDSDFLYINSENNCGTIEFQYKDVLYTTNIKDISNEKKDGFISKSEFLKEEKRQLVRFSSFSEADAINEVFEKHCVAYAESILLEYPHIWELDEERMWNEENKLTLANNTIQFKKPLELFAGLEEGSEIDIFADGQNTMASPKDNPSPWIAEIEIDIRKWIECKGRTKEITEVNQFEFVGRGTENAVYFYFEGMTVIFKKEVPNPYPNNCVLCSDFVSDKDLYCTGCSQTED